MSKLITLTQLEAGLIELQCNTAQIAAVITEALEELAEQITALQDIHDGTLFDSDGDYILDSSGNTVVTERYGAYDSIVAKTVSQETEISVLQAKAAEQQKRIAELETENAEQSDYIAVLQTENEEQAEQITALQSESEDQTKQISALQTENSTQQETIDSLVTQIASAILDSSG